MVCQSAQVGALRRQPGGKLIVWCSVKTTDCVVEPSARKVRVPTACPVPTSGAPLQLFVCGVKSTSVTVHVPTISPPQATKGALSPELQFEATKPIAKVSISEKTDRLRMARRS